MDRTPLHDFYLDLLKNLWIDFLFFIPNDSILAEELLKIEALKEKDFFDKALLFDNYAGPIELDSKRDSAKMMLKAGTLEKNFFQLLHKKGESEALEFDYVAKKYLEQLEAICYVTGWLNDNMTQYLDNLNEATPLFRLQHTNYTEHRNLFVQHFCKPNFQAQNVKPNIKSIIGDSFDELQKLNDNGFSFEGVHNQTPKEPLTNTPQKIKAKTITDKPVKKQPLISNEEAERSILKGIFRLDL
ncbi:hypothetical protein [Mangrovimonas xylaniphaga]|uniref:hypothetical protein n=1 Tax=Mangrovimonas xylaniphaga TaxID=1645915 RepID=UPI0006B41D56|nr:hypothetical protein [Mangrovimonas xylaniphaga]